MILQARSSEIALYDSVSPVTPERTSIQYRSRSLILPPTPPGEASRQTARALFLAFFSLRSHPRNISHSNRELLFRHAILSMGFETISRAQDPVVLNKQ